MISVVIPAYNEEEAIGAVVDELIEISRDGSYEIIVVDDGSTDNTAKVVQEKRVKFIQHPHKMGYGAAIKTGIKNAANDLIMIIDGDGSYPVKAIPELLKVADHYDMIVGSRTGEEVKIQLYRRPAKWFLSMLANYLSETKIPDINSGMRIFRRKDVEKFFNILPNKFSFTTTITLTYHTTGLLVKYVPINYYKRVGQSKIRPVKDGLNFILLIVRTITYFNPLKVFLPISIVLFLVGLAVLLYQGIFLRNIADLPVMLILSAFQIGFLGLLADLIVRKR
jgi:glycosyltransferase involved in cell wall biosynthesis